MNVLKPATMLSWASKADQQRQNETRSSHPTTTHVGSDPGKDPVARAHAARRSRDVASKLGQDHAKTNLSKQSALARHVCSSQDNRLGCALSTELRVVGDKVIAGGGRSKLRVAEVFDFEDGAFVEHELGPADGRVEHLPGLGKAQVAVHLGNRPNSVEKLLVRLVKLLVKTELSGLAGLLEQFLGVLKLFDHALQLAGVEAMHCLEGAEATC